MSEPKTIKINEVEYIRKDSVSQEPAEKLDGMEFCIFRTYSAGCFAGYLESRNGLEAVVIQSIRLWYWDGAFTLSQIAMEGVKRPDECKFAMPVTKHILTEVIEVIPASEQARVSIQNVTPRKYNE